MNGASPSTTCVEDNSFRPARVKANGPLRAAHLDHRQLHRARCAPPRDLRADRRALSVADPVPPPDPRLFPHPRRLLRGHQDRLSRSRSKPSTWPAAACTTRRPNCCAPGSTTSSIIDLNTARRLFTLICAVQPYASRIDERESELPTVLFVCSMNSVRSPIAAALARQASSRPRHRPLGRRRSRQGRSVRARGDGGDRH